VALPDDYWASYEYPTRTIADFLEAVRVISSYQSRTGARFVWRGVTNAAWPLYSSLVRCFIERRGHVPTELELRALEGSILDEAREWGLDWHTGGGRLRGLELLAALQHYGAPTRLVDFTYNPFIALWFAVEKHDNVNGRVFAVDISHRLVTRQNAMQFDPWWLERTPSATDPWTTESWIWRPPPLEARIVTQQGCFLMGGMPSTRPARNVRAQDGWRPLRQDETLQCMSVPFQLIQYEQAVAASEKRRLRGRQPTTHAFTLRTEGKEQLRRELFQMFGLSQSALFPDFAGFAQFGRSFTALEEASGFPRVTESPQAPG
jgi:FRG domain